uniref:Uncharacterized protein n=1 Tax=Cryptomonas curvata TaxID=233186 RepID=A0A7S0MMZ1_9CRYP|mmetsp:Transcript_44342/g.92722  ORF Transcript_44342/g.92722 Transcript_44342/m.92722 type:complete len:261 (+) Transcript_44342:99-881(+)|eukprot:CAMPEP_0172174828 /NCGR_PEP_ID=MMETSP1050-20130122/13886_1 /TAXON_ID=233186 /ORGANISM="Cryptomonas curvata, Strain CCAP979/52" /LENGTH=260 /DNA_ID=CAMNT_0012846857 /DNA_START=99 /DNA_END=881 /DNA_ORIENTATION=+
MTDSHPPEPVNGAWSIPAIASASDDDSVSELGTDLSPSSRGQGKSAFMFDLEHSAMQQPRKRAVLTVDQAAEIFNLRVPFCQATSSSARDRLFTSRSITVSRIYGVSPKAVRDIWNKRTWRHATRALWTEDDQLQHAKNLKAVDDIAAQKAAAKQKSPSLRSVGRPRGSKDSKPRKPRQPRQGDAGDGSSHDPAELALAASPASDDCLAAARPPTDTEDSGAESAAASPAPEDEEEALYRHFPFFLHFPLSVADDAVDAA